MFLPDPSCRFSEETLSLMPSIGFIKEETSESEKHEIFPCPCCGYLVHKEPPGSYSICEICFWEDDDTQLRYPELAGGANKVCLIEGQKNFAALGVCEARLLKHVRKPSESDRNDPEWRFVDPQRDNYERPKKPFSGKDYFDATGATDAVLKERTQLYYWRKNYWRR